MNNKTFEQLINGGVNQVSWINEPLDFTIDYAVKVESALDAARRRWRHAELINGD